MYYKVSQSKRTKSKRQSWYVMDGKIPHDSPVINSILLYIPCNQSHYREVTQWEISMKNIWDLGWFWAGWQYWKKNVCIMSNFWGFFFYVFMGKNFFLYCFENIVVSALKNCIISILEQPTIEFVFLAYLAMKGPQK